MQVFYAIMYVSLLCNFPTVVKTLTLFIFSVLYKLKHLDGEPEIFVDPNEFSKEGLISMSNFEFSHDGQFMAYAVSEKGSDWNKIKVSNF